MKILLPFFFLIPLFPNLILNASSEETISEFDSTFSSDEDTENRKPVSPAEQLRMTCTHEAGHAICHWFHSHGSKVKTIRITLPARNHKRGENKVASRDFYTRDQMFARIVAKMGGPMAELIHFQHKKKTTSGDYVKARHIAHSMIIKFEDESVTHAKLIKGEILRMDDEIAAEINDVIHQAEEVAKEILQEHRHELLMLRDELIHRRFMTYGDIRRLLGVNPTNPRRHIRDEEFEETEMEEFYFGDEDDDW